MSNMRRASLVGLFLWGSLTGCGAKNPQLLDSQVLDRPTDMALVCAHLECQIPPAGQEADPATCEVKLDPLKDCTAPATSSCGFKINEAGVSRVQLFGFAASSGRNEVALVSNCRGEVVDTRLDLPGRTSIPVGTMPTRVASSQDGCKAFSANAGSCDFSVIDTTTFVRTGLGLRAPPQESPETVQTRVPQRLDEASGQWQPLGVSAAAIEMLPSSLLGIEAASAVCSADRNYRAYALFPSCDLLAEIDLATGQIRQSLQWQEDEQGEVQIVNTGQSPVCPIADCATGAPRPAQDVKLSGLSPRTMAMIHDFDQESPIAAALYVGGLGQGAVYEIRVDAQTGDWMPQPRSIPLYGGASVSNIRVSPLFAPNGGAVTSQVDCAQVPGDADARGRTRFAYVVASDGSTRVLQLDSRAQGELMGRECNTQKDPVALAQDAQSRCICVPLEQVDETPDDADAPDDGAARQDAKAQNPNSFRWLAQGPGILPVDPEERIVDWAFVPAQEGDGQGLLRFAPDEENPALNYAFPNLMSAVGMTNRGAFVTTNIGQYVRRLDFPGAGLASVDHLEERAIRRVFTGNEGVDPDLGNPWRPILDRFSTIALGLAPHALHSASALSQVVVQDGEVGAPNGLSRVSNADLVTGGQLRSDPVNALAPSLRLIDRAYVDTSAQVPVLGASGTPMLPYLLNDQGQVAKVADGLGRDAQGKWGLYDQAVPRVVSRDYRSWPFSEFALVWEGIVGGAVGTQGRIRCQNPSSDGTTCQSSELGELDLIDESVDFCQQGVLANDALRVSTCDEDQDCGTGRRCLKRSQNANEQRGLCVSAVDFNQQADALRRACAPFLYNPCGEIELRYNILEAYPQRLALAPSPLPLTSHWASPDSCPRGGVNNHLEAGVCVCDPGMIPCGPPAVVGPEGEALALDCGRPGPDGQSCVDEASDENLGHEVIDRFVCQDDQPEGGCRTDADCDDLRLSDEQQAELSSAGYRAAGRYCIAGMCRRSCVDSDLAAKLTPRDREIIQGALGSDPANAGILDAQACVHAQLPGPACFAELARYLVHAQNAFITRSNDPRLNFFSAEVDPDTGACVAPKLAGTNASLRQSRIALPATEDELADLYPPCESTQVPPLDAPFVCRETQLRLSSPDAAAQNRFHTFAYREPSNLVASLRITNPLFSVNLDLSGLSGLAARIPGQPVRWPASMARFVRARIPPSYSQKFEIGRDGYVPLRTKPSVARGGRGFGFPLVFPKRLIQQAGTPATLFAVDSVAGGAGALGARGQIFRLEARGGRDAVVAADPNFNQVQ